MPIPIEALAVVLAAAALAYAYFATPSLFAPLVSLMISSIVLAMHSPLALSRRMAFLAHAQGHSVLTAALAAAAVLAAIAVGEAPSAFLLAALAFMIALNLAVLAVGRLGYREDVATGVLMSVQITAAVALLYIVRMFYNVDPLALITGEYVLVSLRDVVAQAPFAALASIFPLAYGTRYLYAAIDESFAEAVGLSPRKLDKLFLISMSLAVASSVYALGSLMPAVLLVMPGAIAMRYTRSLTRQLPTATSSALIAVSISHFIYTLIPWLWPSVAVGVIMSLMLFAPTRRTSG